MTPGLVIGLEKAANLLVLFVLLKALTGLLIPCGSHDLPRTGDKPARFRGPWPSRCTSPAVQGSMSNLFPRQMDLLSKTVGLLELEF